MLKHYFLKAKTIDRIGLSWLADSLPLSFVVRALAIAFLEVAPIDQAKVFRS